MCALDSWLGIATGFRHITFIIIRLLSFCETKIIQFLQVDDTIVIRKTMCYIVSTRSRSRIRRYRSFFIRIVNSPQDHGLLTITITTARKRAKNTQNGELIDCRLL